MRCTLAVILLLGCSSPAAPPPEPPATAAPPVTAATPAVDAATVAPAAPAEPSTLPPPPPPQFHCFAWVHGPEFSTDCYRSPELCEQARKKMEAGARPTRPCERVAKVSCTAVGRGISKKEEHCFGDANNCERYRAYVTGNGLSALACVDQ